MFKKTFWSWKNKSPTNLVAKKHKSNLFQLETKPLPQGTAPANICGDPESYIHY